jgi:hypothetical protein
MTVIKTKFKESEEIVRIQRMSKAELEHEFGIDTKFCTSCGSLKVGAVTKPPKTQAELSTVIAAWEILHEKEQRAAEEKQLIETQNIRANETGIPPWMERYYE